MNVPQADLDRAKNILEQHKLQVSDIASPIFKWNLPQMPAKANEKRDEFKASFTEPDADMGWRILQAGALFQYTQGPDIQLLARGGPDKAFPYVRDRLAKAAQLAAKNDIILVVENKHASNVGTGKELGRLLKDVNSPNLRGDGIRAMRPCWADAVSGWIQRGARAVSAHAVEGFAEE